MKTLVMIGAGHSNIVAIGELLPNASSSFKIILISDVALAPYSGMLPGYLAGVYGEEEILFDLNKMQQHYGFELVVDEAVEVNSQNSRIVLSSGRVISYDCLSINTGIWPVPIESDETNNKRIIYAKPLSHLIPAWQEFLSSSDSLEIAVIGAGSAGVEVACALALRNKGRVTLYSKSEAILPEFPETARTTALYQLRRLGINIKTLSQVLSYKDRALHLANGLSSPSDYVFITTGARPRPLAGDLKYDDKGFIRTDQKLLVLGSLNVFAAGDCITFDETPLPKSGVFAVRQGRILAHNIVAFFQHSQMKSYIPQKNFLKILMMGHHLGLAVRGDWSFKSTLAWNLKEYLDRHFMNKYQKK